MGSYAKTIAAVDAIAGSGPITPPLFSPRLSQNPTPCISRKDASAAAYRHSAKRITI